MNCSYLQIFKACEPLANARKKEVQAYEESIKNGMTIIVGNMSLTDWQAAHKILEAKHESAAELKKLICDLNVDTDKMDSVLEMSELDVNESSVVTNESVEEKIVNVMKFFDTMKLKYDSHTTYQTPSGPKCSN